MDRCGLIKICVAWVALASMPFAQATPNADTTQFTCAGGTPETCHPVAMTDAVTPLEQQQGDLAVNLAHSLAKEKKYGEALQTYREFVRVFPWHIRVREARENMARIYEKRQRFDLAAKQYEELYRSLGVSQLGLAYNLEAARLHELQGEEDRAVKIYKELNAIDPNSEAAKRARERMESLNLVQKSGDYLKRETAIDQSENSSPQKE
jgi:TolA-binding protein